MKSKDWNLIPSNESPSGVEIVGLNGHYRLPVHLPAQMLTLMTLAREVEKDPPTEPCPRCGLAPGQWAANLCPDLEGKVNFA